MGNTRSIDNDPFFCEICIEMNDFIDNVENLNKHFASDKALNEFVEELGIMLGHVSFDGRRKITETKLVSSLIIVKFSKYRTMPEGEPYSLSLSKMCKATLD